jgi:hypothetical protein
MESMTSRGHLARAALCLLLVFSPIGAPLIGMFVQGACPVDDTVHPDGPFALDVAYCGISRPIELIYQQSIFLWFFPLAFFGPLLGGLVTIVWWLSGIAVVGRCIWHMWRAITAVTIERI